MNLGSGCRAGFVVGLVTACAGCGFFRERPVFQVPAERVREVQTVSLEEQSRSAPVSVAQATTRRAQTLPSTRPAGEPVELNIAEVRAAALANNLDMRVELLRPEIAQQSVNEELARFEAAFVGAARHQRQESVSPTGLGANAGEFQSYDAGVRVPLRTGGTALFGPTLARSKTGDSSGDPRYDAGLRFSMSQPLLRNAGVDTNTYFIRAARYEKQAVDARTKLEAIRILANADRAYWLLYDARGELDVRQRQLELAQRQVNEARQRVAAGELPGIEVTRAESGLASRLEDIIVAETLVRRTERDLRRIMNRPDLPVDGEATITPTTRPQPVGLDLDAGALADYAVENRMEMLELELRLILDESTIDLERNHALPLFTLDYSYSLVGAGRSPGAAFELNHNNAENWSIAVAAEIPIGNQAAKSRVRRAVLERVQRLATRDMRRLAIRQEVYDAVDQVTQNWQRILAARNEATLAGRTYEAERRQFEFGRRTSTDVLDAADRLALAQSREIHALSDYQIAQVDVAFATGTLLGHGRVVLPPATSTTRVSKETARFPDRGDPSTAR
jgi:outer membrane protein TolC